MASPKPTTRKPEMPIRSKRPGAKAAYTHSRPIGVELERQCGVFGGAHRPGKAAHRGHADSCGIGAGQQRRFDARWVVQRTRAHEPITREDGVDEGQIRALPVDVDVDSLGLAGNAPLVASL